MSYRSVEHHLNVNFVQSPEFSLSAGGVIYAFVAGSGYWNVFFWARLGEQHGIKQRPYVCLLQEDKISRNAEHNQFFQFVFYLDVKQWPPLPQLRMKESRA
jgi:hypothetical protein